MQHGPAAIDERHARRTFVATAALIVFLAFSVRVTYLISARVEYPIRGDVNQYVLYAWNLTHRGVFSSSMPDAAIAEPDSYRGPGYPLMLALTMQSAGHSDLPLRAGPGGRMVLGYETDTWMRLALAAQALLGTLTVMLTIQLARFWVSRSLALAVGMTVALWPHLITFTGVLLSETLFSFTVVLSLWLLCRAEQKGSALAMALAGASYCAAYFVNPVIGLFPVVIAALLVITRRGRLGTVLLLTFIIIPLGWGLRNAGLKGGDSMTGRAAETFVIGSWPQFYDAYNSRAENQISSQIMSLEDEERRTLTNDPIGGLALIGGRIMMDPAYYATWYLLKKPYLLWDWAIRIGAGDLYILKTINSPFDRYVALKILVSIARGVNPALFALALLAVLLVIGRERNRPQAPMIPALLFVYVTLLHVILQAEPRYSVPFRCVEILLAFWVISYVNTALMRVRIRDRGYGENAQQRPGSPNATVDKSVETACQ